MVRKGDLAFAYLGGVQLNRSSLSIFVLVALLSGLAAAPTGAAGTIRIASEISYAPLEFYQAKTHAVAGFDYDLAMALGQKLGAHVEFIDTPFGKIVPGVLSGKYDAGISAMSDTRVREQTVDFVDYFLAGSGILTQAGNPHHIYNTDGLCGLTIDAERGTLSDQTATTQAARCASLGLGKTTVLRAANDQAGVQLLVSKKSAAHLSDYPVVSYMAATIGGGHSFVVAGGEVDVVPFGIAVSKKNVALRNRIHSALLALVADGTYDRLLTKWSLTLGALRSAPINAGTKFEH
jgi:polar amino acid transport system substrate-binding protein